MRLRILTATRFLADQGLLGPEVGTLSGVLLRPFLDLLGDTGPINARTALYAGRSLGEPDRDSADWLAPQGNVKRALRPNLIRETGLTEYDVTWPSELPERLVTGPWLTLRQAVAEWGGLGSRARYRVVCALYKLGLFRAAVELSGMPDAAQIAADDVTGMTALRVASAMSKLGHSTHSLVPYSVGVYANAPEGGRARLAAAINLAIHFGRAARDDDATVAWASRVDAEAGLLRPDDSAADAHMASIALRAACFGPFARGDHEAVAGLLDRAWELARAAMAGHGIPPVLAEENLYALAETRAGAAVARGDRDEALRQVTALTEHDPLEPRAWLQLGAVHAGDGRLAEALAAYQSAAMLGAPMTSVSWYCVAQCREALGDLEGACHAYGISVAAEPLGITALLGLHRTAARTGRPGLADWAHARLDHLHSRVKQPSAAAFTSPAAAREMRLPMSSGQPQAQQAGQAQAQAQQAGQAQAQAQQAQAGQPQAGRVPFGPVGLAGDPAVAQFMAMRWAGLHRFADVLRDRVSETDAECLDTCVWLLHEVRDDWPAIVLHPYYTQWWSRLSLAMRGRQAQAVAALIPELCRFLLVPLARRGGLDGVTLTLPPAAGGEVRLPGHRHHLVTTGLPARRRLSARVEAGLVEIRHERRAVRVTVGDLLDEQATWSAGPLVSRPWIPGTRIEVDSSDPWLGEFLEQESITRPSPGRQRDDLDAAAVTGEGMRRLAGTLSRLAGAWPEMHLEILDYVRLIVPFSSQVRAAFSNVAWHGAVFLRPTLDDEVANAERLVHETSHLRLNLAMTTSKLHEHAPADVLPSPFRAGPRPVTGLYHGAFVVTRAAVALDRLYRRGGHRGYAERIPVLLGQVTAALATLRRDARLTAAGRALLDEVEDHLDALSSVYGTADPQEPRLYREI
jgi:HEXXH motif-containing protein